jgi:excisionase family DNA binding protein
MGATTNRTVRGTGPDSAIHARLERIESLLAEIRTTATKPLDSNEAATYLHQSKSYIYQLTSKGLIAYFKPRGKRIYFLKRDLDAFLLRNRRAATEEVDSAAANHLVGHPVTEVVRKPARKGKKTNEEAEKPKRACRECV